LIAFRVFSFDKSRALQADRELLRRQLRKWFQTLSKSAPRKVRADTGRLRAECEEIADAEGANEILSLMLWAQDMLSQSYDLMKSGEITEFDAHERRIVVKRRFRQFIAIWSRRPLRGKKLIRQYTSKGWRAIAEEPIEAARSAQFLAPKCDWKGLPSSWPPLERPTET
jgi:hypothetical protein